MHSVFLSNQHAGFPHEDMHVWCMHMLCWQSCKVMCLHGHSSISVNLKNQISASIGILLAIITLFLTWESFLIERLEIK